MLKQRKGAKQPDLAVIEMRRLLTERIKTLAATPGEHPTADTRAIPLSSDGSDPLFPGFLRARAEHFRPGTETHPARGHGVPV